MQPYPATCPFCHKTWQVTVGSPYYLRAREAVLKGRVARAACPECLRIPDVRRRIADA